MKDRLLRYQSGEEIRKGDRVLFHGESGEIELVVVFGPENPETDWYLENEGPGVMVRESKVFERAYLRHPEEAEDLVLVARAGE